MHQQRMRPWQQSKITTSKIKGGVFTVDAGEVVFAFPATTEESNDNLGQLLMVLGFRNEAILGVKDTLQPQKE
jgi:hypothetical protein